MIFNDSLLSCNFVHVFSLFVLFYRRYLRSYTLLCIMIGIAQSKWASLQKQNKPFALNHYAHHTDLTVKLDLAIPKCEDSTSSPICGLDQSTKVLQNGTPPHVYSPLPNPHPTHKLEARTATYLRVNTTTKFTLFQQKKTINQNKHYKVTTKTFKMKRAHNQAIHHVW